jgi:polysaccharide deacetylase family protein (PEP-CTERM system associated)
VHIFALDVEEYFDADNVVRSLPAAAIRSLESRVAIGTRLALRLLAEAGAHGTFFVLGTVGERLPELVRDIAAAGHEVASHGYRHRRVDEQGRRAFEQDLARSLDVLAPLAGTRVRGFRAANFSLPRDHRWFFDCLAAHGIEYDSSVASSWFRAASARPQPGRVVEHAVTPIRCGCLSLPSGGGYFRAWPYALTAYGLQTRQARGRPFVFYLHPWELDAAQPRLPLPRLRALRHYLNLRTTPSKLERLLRDFRFTSFARYRAVSERVSATTAPHNSSS